MKELTYIIVHSFLIAHRRIAQRNIETCRNVQKCALMCENVHKRATSAMRPPNFAVKTEAHGTETHRKEGGTPMGGENRE